MKFTHRLISALLAGMILLGAGRALAQDWPQWRGPNRDGKVTGFTAPQTWPKELTKKWSVPVGKGDTSPALVGDRLYVIGRQAAEEVVLCLNAETGKEIWRDHYPAYVVTGPDKAHGGPRSSPAVAEGKVLTVGVGGIVSCYDAASGKLLWRKNEPPLPQTSTSESPIIVDGMGIAYLGGKGKEALTAYNLATGDVKWQWTGDGPGNGSPMLMTVGGTKLIVTMSSKNLVSVTAAEGKLMLQIAFKTQFNAPSPVVDGQTIYVCAQGRGTMAVKIAGQGGALTSSTLWQNTQIAPRFTTPVLRDGQLFGMSDKGYLYCLNAKDGQAAWTDTTKYSAFGSVLDAGTVMLALTETGDLLVFKPSGAKYEEVARYKVSSDPKNTTTSHPIVSGNRVFVKDLETLTLYTIG